VTAFEPSRPDPGSAPPGPAGAPGSAPPDALAPDAPAAPRPTTAPETSGTASPTRRRGRAAGVTAVGALLVAVTVILVLFVVFNTQKVEVSLVFGSVHQPLIIALVVAAALGGLVVGLAAMVRGARLRARHRASNQSP
jgi:uncharacterized integral membrane protein